MTRALDIALDAAEGALKRLAHDLWHADGCKQAHAVSSLVTSRIVAAVALDRLADALDPGPGDTARRQAAMVRASGITAATARTWAAAWAMYGDAQAVSP